MLIPSIDIQNNTTVQLVGGKEKVIDAGDPFPLAEKYSLIGEIAVIDLDAAMGTGDNESLIKSLIQKYPCRVGGGIRDYETAVKWLDAGAKKIIIGTAASKEFLKKLPRERLIVALDSRHGNIVVEGWQKETSDQVESKIEELKEYTSEFLITFVEREGQMKGIDLERAKKYKSICRDSKVTVAGGVAASDEIGELDSQGIDAQVGMAIYTGKLSLVDAFLAPVNFDKSDLIPTVIVDEFDKALGLVYSSKESIKRAIEAKKGIYQSRKRGLWIKGESSGNYQELLKIDIDCDRDSLRFKVTQHGDGFCHKGTRNCWGEDQGLSRLIRRLNERKNHAPEGSYTGRLFRDKKLLESKLQEELNEFIKAISKDHITSEAADLLYFMLVRLAQEDISLSNVETILDNRELLVTRRSGNAKDLE